MAEETELTAKQAKSIPILLAAKSYEKGCKSARISKTTFYKWMQDDGFAAEFDRQRSKIAETAFGMIAQNIETPSVFLEYPRRENFIAEVEKDYDFVAISSFHNQVDDLVEMCQVVRASAPSSKIVLGGWGAVGLEATRDENELGELCDHLCHGEGTRFFRKLLDEDIDRPMFHSHLPRWSYSLPMLTLRPHGSTPVVVG